MSTYFNIAAPIEGFFENKGSKFIAFAFLCYSEEDFQEHLNDIKEKHPKATHHCYAYRIGIDKNNFRANDDGEPSGSAGKPILGQIDSFELSNILIVVVRYYGGTKLGVSGLIQAYKKAAQDALQNANIIQKETTIDIEIICDYLQVNSIYNQLNAYSILKKEEEFSENCKIQLKLPHSDGLSLSLWLKEQEIEYSTKT